jgi:hypothetical protein
MPGQKINYGFMALAVCVVAAFLFLGIAAAPHTDHVCDEESCSICVIAQHTKNLSRQLKSAFVRFIIPMTVFLLSLFILKQSFYYTPVSSVALKIKMNA